MQKVAQSLNEAVVVCAASPGIDATLRQVAKEASLCRIDRALDFTRRREAVCRDARNVRRCSRSADKSLYPWLRW
jgi:hypothetical protein